MVLFATASFSTFAADAWAQDPDALVKVKELNKKAVDSYENLELEEARKALMQALEICATEGMNRHSLKATTHLNLGVVLVGGFKQRDGGSKQFRRALEIDPNARVPKRLLNPEIQAAFNDATREMASGVPPPAPDPAPAAPAVGEPPAGAPPANAIMHVPVTDAVPNDEIAIKAAIDRGLRFDRLVLAYRPEGASDFLARDMEAEAGNDYVARIPEPATRGASVAYYIEARGRGGQALARSGSPDEPHVITLGAQGSGEVAQVDSGEQPDGSMGIGGFGSPGRIWLSLGVGAGGGFAKGHPEVSPNYREGSEIRPIDVSSFAPARLMHFAPEIGYFLSPSLLLSLQGRLQYTTGATQFNHVSCGDPPVCEPATGAVAILARATWLLSEFEKLRPFVSLLAGGGYIRYLVDLGNYGDEMSKCGPDRNQTCVDTVAGGGLLAGPAAGVFYGLTRSLYASGTVTALVGVPKTAINFDLNVGIGYRL